MRRQLLAIVVLVTMCSCKSRDTVTRDKPVDLPTFLNEPSGVPPEPLYASHMSLHVSGAEDLPRVGRIFEADKELGTLSDFLGEKRGSHPALLAPVYRFTYSDPKQFRSETVKALLDAGVRGNLVLWYSNTHIRKRLNDGVANVWRGITRMREELSGKGFKLGGTPVFHLGAVAAQDIGLLAGKIPKGFRAKLGPESGGPQAYFEGPDGIPVVFLTPASRNVLGGGLNEPVESLMPVVRQGGKAWLLIALPIAQTRRPEEL